MNFLIISDSHGDRNNISKAFERCHSLDAIFYLGDGTNDFDDSDRFCRTPLFCVRGNCDSEVDQMVLKFPMRASSGTVLLENGTTVYLTHGHLLDSILAVASMEKEKVCVLYGHTHVPECTEDGNIVLMNPGSVSIPKGGSDYSFMTYENGVFEWKGVFDGLMYRRYEL